jgi:hypothetical protein
MSWATNQLRDQGHQFVNGLMQVVNEFEADQLKMKADLHRLEKFVIRMEPYLKTMELIDKPGKEQP